MRGLRDYRIAGLTSTGTRRLTTLLALMVLASACGGTESQSTNTTDSTATTTPTTTIATSQADGDVAATSTTTTAASTTGGDTGFAPQPADPVSIQAAGDDALAARATIDGAGGVLSVESGGVAFTLTIPEGALLSPVEIIMIPAVSVSGGPLDNVEAAAVILEPDGLVLLEPAALEFQGPDVTTDSVAFAASGTGDDFHLRPAQDDDFVVVAVPHFSIWGTALRANIDDMRAGYQPSAQNAQAVTALATIQHRVSDEQAAYEASLSVLIWWAGAIENRLSAASASDERLEAAVAEFLEWFGMVITHYITSDKQGSAPELEAQLDAARGAVADELFAAIDRAVQRHFIACVREADPASTFRILRWYLIALAMSLPEPSDALVDKLNEWKGLLKKCFSFDLILDTTVAIGDGSVGSTTSTQSTFPIRATDADLEDLLNGVGALPGVKAPIEVTSIKVDHDQDRCGWGSAPGEAEVFLHVDLNIVNSADISSSEIELIRTSTLIRKGVTIYCVAGDFVGPDVGDAFWRAAFQEVHKPDTGAAGLINWDIPIVEDGPTYARLDLEDAFKFGDGEAKVTTKVVVEHRPG